MNNYKLQEINLWSFKQSTNFQLRNRLIGGVKLTENAGFDKYMYF